MNSYEESYEPLENYDKALGKVILTAFILGIIVLLTALGSSAECTNVIGSNGCTVSSSLQLVPGTYVYNGSSSSGALIINGNNIVLDGNGSTLIYGSDSATSYGIFLNDFDNVTIKNFNITIGNWTSKQRPRNIYVNNTFNSTFNNLYLGVRGNRSEGIYLQLGGHNIIKNSNINVSDDLSIGLYGYNTTNLSILNNFGYDGNNKTRGAVFIIDAGTNNSLIQNNTCVLSNRGANGTYCIENQLNSNFNKIYNNNITANNEQFPGISGTFTLFLELNSNYNEIINNTVVTTGNTNWAITIDSGSSHNLIEGNNILTTNTNGMGIQFSDSETNNSIKNNTVRNNFINTTGTNAFGIRIRSNLTVNNTFRDNIIYATGTGANGIKADSYSSDNNLFNNTINVLSIGIVLELQNHRYNIQNNSITTNLNGGRGIRNTGIVDGLTLIGNTFNSVNTANSECIYLSANLTNALIKDNSCTMASSSGAFGFYSNAGTHNNITIKNFSVSKPGTSGGQLFIPSNIFNFTLENINMNWLYTKGNYTFDSSLNSISLLNKDTVNNYYNITGLTNYLVYFSNGSVACSDISTCDNNINITLTPNNYSYVLDNFNVTEGVTRQFSPLSISGTSTSKTITSTLNQGVNASVILIVAKCPISATYQSISYTYDSCSGGQVTYSLKDIPNGNSIITLGFAGGTPTLNECDAKTGLALGIASFSKISNIAPVLITVTLIVYLIFGFKVYRRSGNPKLEGVENIWNAFISLVMFGSLGAVFALVLITNIPC